MSSRRIGRGGRLALSLAMAVGALTGAWLMGQITLQSHGDLGREVLEARILKVDARPKSCGDGSADTSYLLHLWVAPTQVPGGVSGTLSVCGTPPTETVLEVVHDPELQELRTPSTPLTFGLLGMTTVLLAGIGGLFAVFVVLELRRPDASTGTRAPVGERPHDYCWRQDRGLAPVHLWLEPDALRIRQAEEERIIPYAALKRAVMYEGEAQGAMLRQVTLYARGQASLTVPHRTVTDDGAFLSQPAEFFAFLQSLRARLSAVGHPMPFLEVRTVRLLFLFMAIMLLAVVGVTMAFAAVASGEAADGALGAAALASATLLGAGIRRLAWRPCEDLPTDESTPV